MLSQDLAGEFARVALGHVTRQYPHKPDHVLTGPEDLVTPRALHPIFFGSFDWHSCVHAHWLLARIRHRFPTMAESDRIRDHFAIVFTPANVSIELAYLARQFSRTFERPYGWAWLLMLVAELQAHRDAETRNWAATLGPLAEAFAQRLLDFLPKAAWPVRSGVHSNTAFALTLAMEYARTREDAALVRAMSDAALRWYLDDANCQAWEPSGEDFLSPSLIEAVCMGRVLPSEQFAAWLARFLPGLLEREPRALFQPVAVSDRSDGRIAHLDGLNLSRAWCWSSLAALIPDADPRAGLMRDVAASHREASMRHIAEDYMGEHWLATFALLALEAAEQA
jgi:hypothetical protein